MTIRPLHTIDEFRQVIALEKAIWGYGDPDDGVGIPVFVITVKRGGILLGAYDGTRLVGFVYSIAGLKGRTPIQWSHMLGVLAEYRATGLGRRLKLEQRRLSLAMGIDLMEWTVDPLVAVNAHLNFRRLGVVVEEYVLNVYGESSSALHRGAPTDRFIAQWWMRSPRVEAIVAGGEHDASAPWRVPPAVVAQGFSAAGSGVPVVNTVDDRGVWPACSAFDLGRTEPTLSVSIPSGFNELLERDPGLGLEWRMATREIFGHYLGRGYRVVDFAFGPGPREGRYLLSTAETS